MSHDVASDQVGHRLIQDQKAAHSAVIWKNRSRHPSQITLARAKIWGCIGIRRAGQNPQACAKSQLSLSTWPRSVITQQHVKVRLVSSEDFDELSVLRTREIPAKKADGGRSG